MKLLLDECAPARLADSFPNTCEVVTVRRMGWLGTKNGILLQQAADYEFDALVTTDARMEHEQDLEDLPVTIVLLKARRNRFADLQRLVPGILPALENAAANSLVKLEVEQGDEANGA